MKKSFNTRKSSLSQEIKILTELPIKSSNPLALTVGHSSTKDDISNVGFVVLSSVTDPDPHVLIRSYMNPQH